MHISVIIPAYNRKKHLINTIASLVNQDFPHAQYEIIVVDDGSNPPLKSMVLAWKEKFENIRYHRIKRSERDGRGAARNLGIKVAQGEILLFVDSDMICERNLIRLHYAYFQQNKNQEIVVIGNRVSLWETDFKMITPFTVTRNFGYIRRLPASKDDREESFYQFFKKENQDTQVVWEILYSNNFSLLKRTLKKVGGFDKRFQHRWGLEDTDLGYRLHAAGVKFIHARRATAYHQAHYTNWLKNYEDLTENMKLFYEKHEEWRVELYTFYPVITKIAFFKTAFRLEKILKKEQIVCKKIDAATVKYIKGHSGHGRKLLIGGHLDLIKTLEPDTVMEINERKLAIMKKKYPGKNYKPLMGLKTHFNQHEFETVFIHTQRIKDYDNDMILRLLWEAGRIGKKVVIISLEGKNRVYQRILNIVEHNILTACYHAIDQTQIGLIEINAERSQNIFVMTKKIKINIFTDLKSNNLFHYCGIELATALAKRSRFIVNLTHVSSALDRDIFSTNEIMTFEQKEMWTEMKKHPIRYFWDETYHLRYIQFSVNDNIPLSTLNMTVPIVRIGFDRIIPPTLINDFNQNKLSWCPSGFVRNLLIKNGVNSKKIFVVPFGVDSKQFNPTIKPIIPKKKFTFLYMGLPVRNKGFDVVVDAYTQLFTRQDPVNLIIKLPVFKDFSKIGKYLTPETKKTLLMNRLGFIEKMKGCLVDLKIKIKNNPQWPEITVKEEEIPIRELGKYYRSCDCLLFPHREEDFGIEILRAIACGVIPIVTGYYGPKEFCDRKNSLSIKYKLKPFYFDDLNYAASSYSICADPDINDLKDKMRYIFKNKLSKIRKNAMKMTNDKYSYEFLSEKIENIFISQLNKNKHANIPTNSSYSELEFYSKKMMVEKES